MQYAFAALAFAASVSAQVCESTFSGNFEIAPVNISSTTAKRNLLVARAACDTNPIISLNDGKLLDQQGRTGSIVANQQFQFDEPVQENAISTGDFSVCPNNTLAHSGGAVFYGCKSGDFSNLYAQSLGEQCYQIYIQVVPCEGGSSASAVSSAPSTSAATVASSAVASITTTMTPYQPAMPSAPSAPVASAPAAAPYPVANATAPAPSGSAAPSAPGAATTSPLTAPASGAETLAIGAKFGVVAAGVLALFALL